MLSAKFKSPHRLCGAPWGPAGPVVVHHDVSKGQHLKALTGFLARLGVQHVLVVVHHDVGKGQHLKALTGFLARLGVQHVLVVVHHDVGEGQHVAGQEVGAPALLAPVLPQVLQRVHARVQHLRA